MQINNYLCYIHVLALGQKLILWALLIKFCLCIYTLCFSAILPGLSLMIEGGGMAVGGFVVHVYKQFFFLMIKGKPEAWQ